MEERTWLKVAVILCLFAVSNGRELKLKHKDHSLAHYNHTLATILVEYASAVYMSDLTELFTWTCSRCDDMTEGFEIIELVVDIQHCLQAFVGVAQDLNAVIIAFRGTQEHSIQNWVEDLYWKQLDLNYPGMPDAMVHHGFYYAYHNTTIRPGVLNAVKRAREIYGNVPIMVTGHSMGGAMASFCGLDLIVITIRPFLISLKVYFSCYTSMRDFLSVNIIALLLSLLSLLASSFQWPLNNMVYCVRFLLNYCYGYGKNTQELMCTDVDVVAWCVYNSVTIFSLIYTFQAVKSKNAHRALNFTFSGICLQVAYLALLYGNSE